MEVNGTFSKIEIEKNTISYRNAIVQTSNISKISLDSMEKKKIPFVMLVPAVLLFMIFYIWGQQKYSWLSLFVCMVPIIFVAIYNLDLGIFLVLTLNSGDKVYFECKDKVFLETAFIKISDSIKSGKTISINFSNCTINSAGGDLYSGDNIQGDKIQRDKISDEKVHIPDKQKNIIERDEVHGDKVLGDKVQGDKIRGNKNITVNGDKNRLVSVGELKKSNYGDDWEEAESIFKELLNCYRFDTDQYGFCEMAQIYCAEKNRTRLQKLIEHKRSIFDSIVAGVASTGFIELMKRLTGIIF